MHRTPIMFYSYIEINTSRTHNLKPTKFIFGIDDIIYNLQIKIFDLLINRM